LELCLEVLSLPKPPLHHYDGTGMDYLQIKFISTVCIPNNLHHVRIDKFEWS